MAQFFKPVQKRQKKQSQFQAEATTAILKIDSLDTQGQGVGRGEQGVVFVPGALPGETVQVRIVEQKKRFVRAQVEKLIAASEHRIEPGCEYFGRCGGCQTQHCEPEALLRWKQFAIEQLLLRQTVVVGSKVKRLQDLQGSLPWQSAIHSKPWGYRRKTRLSVDARQSDKVKLGFRQRQSSDIVSINHCGILVPELDRLLLPLQALLASLNQPQGVGHISLYYDEKAHVCLRVTRDLPAADKQSIVSFAEDHDCQIYLETNSGEIQPLELSKLPFTPMKMSSAPELELHTGINDFVQVNDDVNRAMVAQSMRWLDLQPQDKVLDLFCGVGNFSLAIAQRVQQVVGVEGVSKMVQQAQINAQKNGITNASFVQGDLSNPATRLKTMLEQCNKVLLDPAREGAFEVMEQLGQISPSHLVYVSCNPNTFARDGAKLMALGYRIDKISVLDMFPQTAHTELMALFVPLQSG